MDINAFTKLLGESQPSGQTELNFTTPLEALVAVILSAQCRDAYVNRVTPTLFEKYRSVDDYISISQEELERDISSITFFRKKAATIKRVCVVIRNKYNRQVPSDVTQLKAITGIGPKTANVIAGLFGKTAGFVVDTHVKRVAYRVGLTNNTDPEKIRTDLEGLFTKEEWGLIGGRMILHGRYTCMAIGPKCNDCKLRLLCAHRGL